MINETPKKENLLSEGIGIVADPNKRIPKYCTSVLVSKLNNGHVIMTFLQKDYTADDKDRSIEGSVLIERILFDKEHFESVFNTIKKVIEETSEKQ